MKFERVLRTLRWLMILPPDQTKKLPDLTTTPEYANETFMEVTYSRQKIWRSVITKKSTRAVYCVTRERWATSDFEHTHRGYWVNDDGPSMTDTIEIARRLAKEKLAGH